MLQTKLFLYIAKYLKIFNLYFYNRIYMYYKLIKERETLDFFKSIIKNDWIIVDVGANLGFFSNFFCQICNRGKVIGFEPNPEHKKSLSQLQNKFSNYKYFPIALGNISNTKSSYYISSLLDIDNRMYAFNESCKTIEVEMEKFDNIFKSEKLNLIKIDVQGYEIDVLEGMKETINEKKPYLYVEIWPSGLKESNRTVKDLKLFLDQVGYVAYEISNKSLTRLNWEELQEPKNYYFDKNIFCKFKIGD